MASNPEAPRSTTSGTWYLAQAADGAWQLFMRSQSDVFGLRTLVELAGYPAVVTPNGNLFHLGTSRRRLAAMREH
ncbi:MAG: hypothetical protein ACYC5O_07775 [Anaerolineae bacterium]